ncbi:MAG: polysaccharide deacetylase family protein [Clostridia bacterium]|jgi:peptidoglycan/xylan/chitin deacetylase (PgdA/CDA1 family)
MPKLSHKFFVNIISNLIISLVLISIFAFTFVADIQSVSGKNDNSPIFRGNTDIANVSLMFNVYTGTEYIEPIMQVLKNNNVTATFFVGGSWANSNTNTVKSIYEQGFEIGNHGYWHKDHKKLSVDRNQEEIYITHQLIKELTNYSMTLFAPPSGSYSGVTLDVATNLGYTTIMWSKDTIDWRDKNQELVYNRATKNPKNGDLILMHPTAHTLSALDSIIKFYLAKNFNIVSVSQNINPV